MKRVESWKTDDGELHRTQEDAAAHELYVLLADDPAGADVSHFTAAVIVQNRERVIEMLNFDRTWMRTGL
jgi:hypothetical protein